MNSTEPHYPTQAARAAAESGTPRYVLAAEIRIGPSDLSRILAGRQIPTGNQARRIAERLGLQPDELLEVA